MLRSFIYIGIGGWLLLLGMLGLIALAISCMIRGDKLRFPGLFLSFILLAFLSLDGGYSHSTRCSATRPDGWARLGRLPA